MSNPAEYKFKFNDDQSVKNSGKNINGKTVFELEQQVVDDLNKFYSTFYNYLRCTATDNVNLSDNKKMTAKELGGNYNCNNPKTSDNVKNDYTTLQNSIKQLNNALAEIHTSGYKVEDIDKIVKNYNDVLKLRNELDIKMANLNGLPGTPYAQYKASHDSTVYASIVWSVLATSLIYYVFVHL